MAAHAARQAEKAEELEGVVRELLDADSLDAGQAAELQRRFDAACLAAAATLGSAPQAPRADAVSASADGAELARLLERRDELERRVAAKDDELRRLAIALQTFRVHLGMLQTASGQHGSER